ncbi:hypothetical protein TIFTF001_011532 [Ficus carica]|uniref:AMP-dependent synthetase/ligase domain-containing protein n=1 Tax=Ficus carica TaxID=3494 RepID=A0AA88AAN0_FICCA|nr:hypothetical protein TIFTF001_011532 [Ficus carica]
MENLPKCQANYVPLTPMNFLTRASAFYADRTSVIYEGTRFTWRQTFDRCRRLASSLRSLNVVKNNVVSVLAPNVPAMYEMHFAVPMAGAVLNTINTRLDAKNIATILQHSEAKIFFVDYQFVHQARDALRILTSDSADGGVINSTNMPLVIVIDDIDTPTGTRLGELEYEDLVRNGNPMFVPVEPADEWDPIALNYTSGTTSAPKGVVYSHRGAYLSTLSLVLGWEMGSQPVYLWTLPMFHCNGWTFTWGVAARGGTNVCIRNTTAHDIYRSVALHGVTHMCCAPIVFNILLEAKPSERRRILSPVEILTGGAPPPAALLEKIESLGFHVTHAYGSVEVESVLYRHPEVLEAAVVAMPHRRWGESPCAFVALKNGGGGVGGGVITEGDIMSYCRKNMPHFMVPKKVKFVKELPKTSTGKVQKYELRALAKTFTVEERDQRSTPSTPSQIGVTAGFGTASGRVAKLLALKIGLQYNELSSGGGNMRRNASFGGSKVGRRSVAISVHHSGSGMDMRWWGWCVRLHHVAIQGQ